MHIKNQYHVNRHSNYSVNQCMAIIELREMVNNEQIVICKSDKDSKIYDNIMINELSKFAQLIFLTKNNLENHLEQIR